MSVKHHCCVCAHYCNKAAIGHNRVKSVLFKDLITYELLHKGRLIVPIRGTISDKGHQKRGKKTSVNTGAI